MRGPATRTSRPMLAWEVRPYTGPSVVWCSVTWRLRSAKSRVRERTPPRLLGEIRRRTPPEPGQIERYDCEYKRNGTANLFISLDAHRSWRKVKVTERRTAEDFAACMRELADLDFPEADRIRVVL